MHGITNPKFINAKQAGDIYAYKNIKQKLYKTIAAIWFNKTCRKTSTSTFIRKPEAATAV
jgi:GH24 family phage-related lysozyme (muramidase)